MYQLFFNSPPLAHNFKEKQQIENMAYKYSFDYTKEHSFVKNQFAIVNKK